MPEDTRRWANASAGTPVQLASAITSFNVAQRWEKEAQERGSSLTRDDSGEALDKISTEQAPERA